MEDLNAILRIHHFTIEYLNLDLIHLLLESIFISYVI